MVSAPPTAARPAAVPEKPLLRGVSHEIAAFAALAAWIGLVAVAAPGPARAAASVYGATLLALFTISALYHRPTWTPRARLFWRRLDHSAIFLLIAGTYTPFALVSLSGPDGWTLFAASWSFAFLGILQELWIAKGARLTSLVLYVLMGWMGLALMAPLVHALTWNGFAWLVAGGLVYTAGIVFYLFDERFRHWHGIWHLFVMAGSAIHFFTILKFVA